jgi:protein O-GlcNAc transferase
MRVPPSFRGAVLAFALGACCLAATDADVVKHAAALAHSGRVKDAETLLRSAVSENADSATLHGALGTLLFEEQNYTDSVQELNQAEQLDPDSREYNMLLAAALLGAKRDGVAKTFLLAVEPRFKQYPEFHYSLGLAYYNMAQIAKSEAELKTAIKIDPKMDRANFLLAACYASGGEFAKAAATLRLLTASHPKNVIYWATLGDVLRQTGAANRPEALRACHKALAIDPGNAHAQFVLATTLLDAGDFAGACGLLEHLEQISPKELEAHVALARVYSRLGKLDLARKETEIVRKLQENPASDSDSPVPKAKNDGLEQR